MQLFKINVPGRVISFYTGGGAYSDYRDALLNDLPPVVTRDLSADELELFNAVRRGRTVYPAKGGYYVRAEMTAAALDALAYWADTLETASQDDASYDPDARLDLTAARKARERVAKALRSA